MSIASFCSMRSFRMLTPSSPDSCPSAIESEMQVLDCEALAKKVLGLIDYLPEKELKFHCVLALASFPENEALQRLARALCIPREAPTMEMVLPWIPKYGTDRGFLLVGSQFIQYGHPHLAREWFQLHAEQKRLSPTCLTSFGDVLDRFEKEKRAPF